MVFRRLFRRGWEPPTLAGPLLAILEEAGLTAKVVEGDLPERKAGIRAGVIGRGLVQVTAGPPDFVQVTSEEAGAGHLMRSSAIGFHFLVRREGLADSMASGWGAQGKVVAQREFGGVGPANAFRWAAALEEGDVAAPQAVASAERLNALGTLYDSVLGLLRDPTTLVVEVAPDLFEAGPTQVPERPSVIRASLFLGRREELTVVEVETMRGLCRGIAARASEC